MRRKVASAIGVVFALVAATLFTVVAPAGAQYPPACTPASAGSSGSVAVGGTLVVTLDPSCEWTPGAAVAVEVNGTPIPGKTANEAGAVGVSITVLSATQLSVDDPVLTPAQCGSNVVSASGPSSVTQGGRSSHVETFTVLCPGAAPAPGQVTRGRVALTGANLTRWGIIAFGLVVIGALFVVADRRKARSRD